MNPILLIINKNYRNKLNSLPNIRSHSTKHNTNEISYSYNNNKNNLTINQTTKASLSKSNSSNIIFSNKLRKLKKIKLNQSLINEKKNYFPQTNINKNMIKLIKNADNVMKQRNNSYTYIMEGGRNYSKKYILKESKEISKKNYSINLLKEKRTEINLKSYLMDQALNNFNTQFEKDYHDFNIFISIKEEDILGKVIKIREKTEQILKQEQSLNESLHDLIVKRVKSFFTLKKYGSFFHELIEKPFLYNKVPDKMNINIDFEDIANIIINIYETEEKYKELPEDINNNDLFMNKYTQLEDIVLYTMRLKHSLDKEIKNDIIIYNKELEMIKEIKQQYEKDLDFYKGEKYMIDLEIKKSKIYTISIFDDFLEYISELGNIIGVKGNLPQKSGKEFDEYISYGKKTLDILENMEIEINKYINIIENIVINEEKKKEKIMKEIILNQKNINKLDFKLSFKQLQEKMKIQKDLKTIEKGKKLVVKGRIIYKYPNIKHNKKIKKIIIKKENEEDELHYSDTEEEKK